MKISGFLGIMSRLTTDQIIVNEMTAGNTSLRNILSSLETRLMSDRKIVWSETKSLIANRYEICVLETSDKEGVEQTAHLYRVGFPELFGGVYEDILFPTRYERLVEHMRVFMLRDWYKEGLVVSAWALSPSEKNMSVEFSLTVTHPDYRGKGLCKKFTTQVNKLVEDAGAEQGVVYCATFHVATQKVFTDLGFERQGVLRGFILANVGGGRYVRDNVIMFTKLYRNADRLCPSLIRDWRY